MSDKMPLSEIRRILERGEWWDNVRDDVSPDEPCPWLDELNGAIEAALDELTEHETAEKDGRLVELPCKIGERVYEVSPNFKDCQYPAWVNDGKDNPCAERMQPVHCKACDYYRADKRRFCECPHDNIRAKLFEYGDIGKVGETVFLTAQEAEAALKAMEAKA